MPAGRATGVLPALALPVLDPALAERLVARMAEVEERLEREITSEADFITEACRHLLHAGGKRIRPLLVLMAAEAGGSANPPADAGEDPVLTAACVVELTHLASLYHDDVMDEALLRRGAESANARWDNHVSILAGDWLFSKSSELTADLGAEAVRIQAQTFSRLVEGQILETQPPATAEGALEHHLRVIAGKTGSLIATSARYGAMFAGAVRRGDRRAHRVRRDGRRRLPAQRRHPRRRQRQRRVRQDPRHRPARGRPDAAGALRPGLDPARGRPAARAAGPGAHRRRRPRRGARPAAGPPGDGPGPVPTSWTWPAGPASGSTYSPTGPVRDALVAFADLIATRTT